MRCRTCSNEWTSNSANPEEWSIIIKKKNIMHTLQKTVMAAMSLAVSSLLDGPTADFATQR